MRYLSLLALLGISICLQAQSPLKPDTLRVMFYNVENLFDCKDDTLKDDAEFLPKGAKKWSHYRYWKKQKAISRVIAAVGDRRMPALVGLCEVENDSVLSDLTKRSPLRTTGYDYVMTSSPDERGMDVALLYLPESFRLFSWREIRVNGLGRPTRNIGRFRLPPPLTSGRYPPKRPFPQTSGTYVATCYRLIVIHPLRAPHNHYGGLQ